MNSNLLDFEDARVTVDRIGGSLAALFARQIARLRECAMSDRVIQEQTGRI
jgi:hypothetical protein